MKPKFTRIIDGIPCMTVTEHEEILKQLEAQEPVAWRLRLKGAQQWVIWDTNPIEMMDGGKFDVEPLYAEPFSSQNKGEQK
jgi:hypothetical protein